ncbi:MAG: Gfo/Idh/MocA family oxidoreductase [Gemmataceae bacterium]|nr:Gfo/Idh/MocA family oxidoreductase [Gemmataceae bacterium]
MDFLSRREFLNRAAILSAAAAAGRTATADEPAPAAKPAGDKLRVAVVGVRSRGMDHVRGFAGKNGCEITTVCDCDEAVIGPAMKTVEKAQGQAPRYVKDFRKLLDDKEIDIVSIATPNHWHALMAVWAMQAGKDVYVEKPASHNVREGAVMVAAARKYGRLCQVGTQSRSNPGMREAIAAVRGGKIGAVRTAIGLCYKKRDSIGTAGGPQEPPKTMDYDLWCGPAPLKPPHRKTGYGTVHYDWHWTWDYGNGDLGNQGVHEMDKARWGLGVDRLPEAAGSVGGRFGYSDDGETANTQFCVFNYGGRNILFEVRGLKTDPYKGAAVGNIFVGDEGSVVCPNYSGGIQYDRDGKEVARFGWDEKTEKFVGSDQHHFDNFVKAVRSRKVEDLNCDIAEGHQSAALCHLANISYRLGREHPVGGLSKGYGYANDDAMREMSAGLVEHLRANKVDVDSTAGRFGKLMGIAPDGSHFPNSKTGQERGNPLLTREYRKGFELPAL